MAKLQTDEAKAQYRKRTSTVEPVFGIINSVLGFTRFQLRSIEKGKMEGMLVALAYNCKRLNAMRANGGKGQENRTMTNKSNPTDC